jgi:hypothetical protein
MNLLRNVVEGIVKFRPSTVVLELVGDQRRFRGVRGCQRLERVDHGPRCRADGSRVAHGVWEKYGAVGWIVGGVCACLKWCCFLGCRNALVGITLGNSTPLQPSGPLSPPQHGLRVLPLTQ